MNICIAVTTLKYKNGGVCTHIIDLCRYYSSIGHKILLIADGSDYNDTVKAIRNVIYKELPFSTLNMNPAIFIKIYKKMSKICKQEKIDIIHVHGQCIIPIAYLYEKINKTPFLWTNHIDAIPRAKLLSVMRGIMKFPVISVSEELKKDLVERLKFTDQNLYIVENGVNFDNFTPLSENEKKSLKKTFNIQAGEFVIAELARLNHGKGQDLLIKAVKILQDKKPQYTFHILFAGMGDINWFKENVINYAKKNKIKVSYIGFNSPRSVFGVADLSVLPSLYEGFPLTVLESLAMKCPAIRSDTPGASAMQNYCKIFKKGNLQELVNSLLDVIDNYSKWKQVTDDCQNEIRSKFSKEHMGMQTIKIYEHIIKIKQK